MTSRRVLLAPTILSDDRVINYASSCTTSCPAARRCGSASYSICYSVLDPARYPWGLGAGSRPFSRTARWRWTPR